MRYLALFLCLFSSIASANPRAVGLDAVTRQPFFLLKDLPPVNEVYRGTKSVAGEFPMMGWIGNCTATAVARDVIFTASHCVSNGARINFAHRQSGRSFPAVCTRHPQYNNSTIANDWTLCKLSTPLPEDAILASFKIDAPLPVAADVLVNGYGAPNVGTHYWGKATIRSYQGQDIVTCGPANLGGGDSGGSLLVWTEDRSGNGYFDIIGVNSRGNNSCSWYNRVTDTPFITFARDYESRNSVQLCGVSADCKGPAIAPAARLPTEISSDYGVEIAIGVRPQQGVSYTWSTGESTSVIYVKPTQSTVYTLRAANRSGQVETSVSVKLD